MFRKRGFFRVLLIGLFIIGLFSVVGSASYRSGWSQGYFAGQSTSGEDGTAVTPPPYYGHRGWGGGFFSPIFWIVGAFFKFWLFLFLMGVLFKFLRAGGRRHAHRYGHKKWGHMPPWYDDSGDEPIMKA